MRCRPRGGGKVRERGRAGPSPGTAASLRHHPLYFAPLRPRSSARPRGETSRAFILEGEAKSERRGLGPQGRRG